MRKKEKLAATYSRGAYRTTTIGKTVFDGRVRNGNGSDHSFIATKKRALKGPPQGDLNFSDSKSVFSENCT